MTGLPALHAYSAHLSTQTATAYLTSVVDQREAENNTRTLRAAEDYGRAMLAEGIAKGGSLDDMFPSLSWNSGLWTRVQTDRLRIRVGRLHHLYRVALSHLWERFGNVPIVVKRNLGNPT